MDIDDVDRPQAGSADIGAYELTFINPSVTTYTTGIMPAGVNFGEATPAAPPAGCGGTQTFVGDPGDTESFEYQADDFCTTEFSVTDNDSIISTYDGTQVKNGSYAASIAFTGSGTENDNFIQANLEGR